MSEDLHTPYSYRGDPAVPAFADDRPIVVFDGWCAMCSRWAGLILRFDRARRFRLLPAQSELGRALYRHYGQDAEDHKTNMLLQDGLPWFRSESTIRMAEGLGWPWKLAGLLRLLPLRRREALYELLARNRYRFGRRSACYLPPPEHRDRFLA
jgi:predicted DCC family thiol-disulfide oxidoreductase YuxK